MVLINFKNLAGGKMPERKRCQEDGVRHRLPRGGKSPCSGNEHGQKDGV